MKIRITRSAGDYNIAEIDISEIRHTHWGNVSGGVNKRQTGYSLYAYIDYNRARELNLCSGEHSHYNNPAKVMIPASLNKTEPFKEAYDWLASRCGAKPEFHYRALGNKPCTKRILELLATEGSMKRIDIRKILIEEHYPSKQIAGALNRMSKDGRIVYQQGNSNMQNQIIALGEGIN